ncbi:ABC transporter ATP-binding protein [Sphingobacterium spiritivorum]|uniref:ABC transporter ATP-binding protein n=1 Tax=Sphingobacterium spiritivorum TaxID=258 RepID=UPI00191B62EF|nr:ABC transporter ATP-binding protein [Sphingobacterium spiritivorum]QQT27931.1 ABC transporter ATP-binding protein [Sphingobacterium spiritivorum]
MQELSSCQFIPSDVQQPGLPLVYGENVSCIFENKEKIVAVDHVSFSVNEGEITSIIGESGSGKSTLLKLIYGLLEPQSGSIRYRGWLVPTRKDKLIPGHPAMKLVSQGFDDLNLYAKVWDNVASQLSNTNLQRKQDKTQEVLEKLNIAHLANQRVADLSGGEKQRVAISRALINEPEVLLMDEPFNQVDAAFRDNLQQDIKQIVKETGLTVILISHDPAEVLSLSDRLMVMKKGKIVDQGSPEELYYHPTHSYTAQLLAKSNLLSPEQAAILGIQTTQQIAIHQEWIKVQRNASSSLQIKDVRFRGFYNELTVGNDQLSLHLIDHPISAIERGTTVEIAIDKYISF